jgi:2-keto-4-pentenoate hydratase
MIQESAFLLDSAERNLVPIAPLSETYPSFTPGQAYAIQSAWFALKLAQGARLVARPSGIRRCMASEQAGRVWRLPSFSPPPDIQR